MNEQIKDFIKQNLVIEIEYEQRYSPGNNMIVSLRFKDDKEAFSKATILIPDNN